MTADEFAQHLKGVPFYLQVEAQGPGLGYLSTCPICGDNPKSGLCLAFNQIKSDLVVSCYGGCSEEGLLSLLSLEGIEVLTARQWIDREIKQSLSRQQAREVISRLLLHPSTAHPQFKASDVGNSERLVNLHGEHLRFSRSLGWMVWSHNRWVPDATGEVYRLAVDTVRSIYQEAANTDDDKERKALAKHALSSEGKGRIKAAVEMAEFAQGVACRGDEFDQNPWAFNCVNGTIDLQTGELAPHRPSDMLTQLSPVRYDPEATCPTWERYLSDVMQGNQALVSFLQRAAGYTLTGNTGEQKFFLCWGGGRNGKGVFMNVLLHLLGNYSKVSQFKTFEESQERANTPRGDLVSLRGKRLVFASENQEKMPLAEALIKGITGNDPLTARQLHREEITFTPAFKLWLFCNHKPIIKGTDEAIWERVLFIPWLRFLKPEERDFGLTDKLKKEASGILNWALEGCRAWQQEGLNPPAEVRAAIAEYREEMDTFSQFLNECCLLKEGARAKAKDLFASYQAFCSEEGIQPQTQTAFGLRLSRLGLQSGKNHGNKIWIGVGLLVEPPKKEKGDSGDSGDSKLRSAHEESEKIKNLRNGSPLSPLSPQPPESPR